MGISYDNFSGAFLAKVSEFNLLGLIKSGHSEIAQETVDGYMKRAVASFKNNCKYDLASNANDSLREFSISIPDAEIDEIIDIISDGMVVQWLKPYVYKQELLENGLNTRDFTTYSPAELLHRVGEAYKKAQKDYVQSVREYSYNNGKLSELHL